MVTMSDNNRERDASLKLQVVGWLVPEMAYFLMAVLLILGRRTYKAHEQVPVNPQDTFNLNSSDSDDEQEHWRHRTKPKDPAEYLKIIRLVQCVKRGDKTATVLALCAILKCNLSEETNQLAVMDEGGLQVLLNLLDTDATRCQMGSLKILKEIGRNRQVQWAITDHGGIKSIVRILDSSMKDLRSLAAETMASVVVFHRARRSVQFGAIKKLVSLLDCPSARLAHLNPEQQRDVEFARCGALALSSCSKSSNNKRAILQAGGIKLMANLLRSSHKALVSPVVSTLEECASEKNCQISIKQEGVIPHLVRHLQSGNPELQKNCVSTIFKCAEDTETMDLVRTCKGLNPMVSLLAGTDSIEMLTAAAGAVWKCSLSQENTSRFRELKAVEALVSLLNTQSDEALLVNVVGALGECAKDSECRSIIQNCGGIPRLVSQLKGDNQVLLINAAHALCACAVDREIMENINRLDGVRFLWSLLKNQSPEVKSSAAWAICPCLENTQVSDEVVRSFLGGLRIIVYLLSSDHRDVLAPACAIIAIIAKNHNNLNIMTDFNVVSFLANLTGTTDDLLRKHLADAIASCCAFGDNCSAFGKAKVVAPLVEHLKSPYQDVNLSTAQALHQLSKDPQNCFTMFQEGVVKPLVVMMGADNEALQLAAANCVRNIRLLALAYDKQPQDKSST
uniref:outer dynein arm-docking complex subunit 2-like n=1 Tax=Myxine glutinosa TaxID=7769 RepID=UPI00358E4BA4